MSSGPGLSGCISLFEVSGVASVGLNQLFDDACHLTGEMEVFLPRPFCSEPRKLMPEPSLASRRQPCEQVFGRHSTLR